MPFNLGRGSTETLGVGGVGAAPKNTPGAAFGAQPGAPNASISTAGGVPPASFNANTPPATVGQPAGSGKDVGGGPTAPNNGFFAQQAANYTPGSDMYQFWNGFANNPSAANNPYAQALIGANSPGGAAFSPSPAQSPGYPGGVPLGASPSATAGQPAGLGANAPQSAPGAVAGTLSGGPVTGGAPGAFSSGTLNQPGNAPQQQSPALNTTPNFNNSLLQNMNWLGPLLGLFGMSSGGGAGNMSYGGYPGYGSPFNSPGAIWSQLFGPGSGGGTGYGSLPGSLLNGQAFTNATGGSQAGGNGGTDLTQLFSLFGQPGTYNPYGLPLYTRQAMQYGNGFQ